MALVEVEQPERMVDVKVPVTHRDDAVEMTLTVPERFYAVPRCRDEAGCKERELLSDAAPIVEPVTEPEPVVAAVEDPFAWL
jgi:hypothetical protein